MQGDTAVRATPGAGQLTLAEMRSIEVDLRQRLRGVRLISEVDLWGEAFEKARALVHQEIRSGNQRDLGRYRPASLVTYLVGEGVRGYDGAYWDKLEAVGARPSDLGPGFRQALETLRLEAFIDRFEDRALKYVAPILFHGGIPRYCAADVLQLVRDELHRGAADALDMVAGWRRNPTRLDALDKPARRFIQHAGDEAIDLLDRLIELVLTAESGVTPDAEVVGIPAYFVDRLGELDTSSGALRRRERIARPRLQLDPWSGEGPQLLLPAVSDAQRFRSWTILGSRITRLRTSIRAEQPLDLDPHGSWQVDLGEEPDQRSFSFHGVEGLPAYFFDTATGDLLRDQMRLRAGHVDLLLHRRLRVTDDAGAPMRSADELPALDAPWSHYRVLRLDLRDQGAITIGAVDGELANRRIILQAGATRPTIEGELVEGVTDLAGAPVYASAPRLRLPRAEGRWRVRVTAAGQVAEADAEHLPAVGGARALDDLLPSGVARARVEVRGSLGSDLKAVELVVVPGLVIDQPEHIVGPDEVVALDVVADAEVTVHGPDVHHGAVTFTRGATAAQVHVSTPGGEHVPLQVVLPRVRWALRTAGSPLGPLTTDGLVVGADQLRGTTLVLNVGRRACVALLVVDGDDTTMPLQRQTTGIEGRWAFDLSALSDTVRRSRRSRLGLELEVDGRRHRIGAIVAQYVVRNLSVESLVDTAAGISYLDLRFTENRRFSGREVRFWSIDRPWASPVVQPMEDDAAPGRAEVMTSEVPAGSYLVEVTTHDGWTRPRRPSSDAPGVARVVIGEGHDEALRVRQLDPADPLDALELIYRGDGHRVGTLADDAVAEVGGEILVGLGERLAPRTKAVLRDRGYQRLKELLFQSTDVMADVVTNAVGDDILSFDIAVLEVTALLDAVDCPFETARHRSIDRMYRAAPALAAACDSWTSTPGAPDRWAEHLGWRPGGPDLYEGGRVKRAILSKSAEELDEIEQTIDIKDTRPLTPGGHHAALFDWLGRENPDGHERTGAWRTCHAKLGHDRRILQSRRQARIMAAVTPVREDSTFTRFPAEVQAAAFHLLTIPSTHDDAVVALWSAIDFAPLLVRRALMVAIAVNRLD